LVPFPVLVMKDLLHGPSEQMYMSKVRETASLNIAYAEKSIEAMFIIESFLRRFGKVTLKPDLGEAAFDHALQR
jgi:hypothetical protein